MLKFANTQSTYFTKIKNFKSLSKIKVTLAGKTSLGEDKITTKNNRNKSLKSLR